MQHRSSDVATIVLAAGRSTRMGSPKPLLEFQGVSFLRRVIDTHLGLGLHVLVVLGEQIEAILEKVDVSDVTLLANPRPELGQLSSLHVALRSLKDVGAAVVHPVDHPLVRQETVSALLAAHRSDPTRILLPEYGGRTGHPTLFPARFFGPLLDSPLDRGARYVVHGHRESVTPVAVDDAGILRNIDTPEEYRRLLAESVNLDPRV